MRMMCDYCGREFQPNCNDLETYEGICPVCAGKFKQEDTLTMIHDDSDCPIRGIDGNVMHVKF